MANTPSSQPGRLAGKTAFITAASQNIGRAMAEAFVREGARGTASDLNETLLATLKTDTGYVHAGSVLDCSEAEWDVAFQLKVRSQFRTTNAAVIGLTKAVAADFVAQGIRCNAICPGTVESPSLRERIKAQAATSGQTLAQVEAAFVSRQPMGRRGRAEEIAALAVYLASDESAFTTGTSQVIDGGWSN